MTDKLFFNKHTAIISHDRTAEDDIEYICKDKLLKYLRNGVIPPEESVEQMDSDDAYTRDKVRAYKDILSDIESM